MSVTAPFERNEKAASIDVAVQVLLVSLAVLFAFATVATASESFSTGSASAVEIGQASTTHDVSFDVELADGETTHFEINTSSLPAGASLVAIQGVTANTTDVSVAVVGVTGSVANVSVTDETALLISPSAANVTVTLELDTSGVHAESTNVRYEVDEVGVGADPDGTVSVDLVDTTAPTYDSAVTGDLPAGNSGANDSVTLNVTEDGTGLNASSVTADDFRVDGSPPTETNVTTVDGQDVVRLALDAPLETDTTPRVNLTGSIEDAAGNVLGGPVRRTAADGLVPVISSASYDDTDGDGQVDRVNVTYSEDVAGSYVDGEWSISTAGTVSLSKNGTGGFSTPSVLLDVSGAANTTGGSNAPEVRYDGSTITDDSVNANEARTETVRVDDAAAPVNLSVEAKDTDADGRVNRVDVTYSEDVSASDPEAGDYALGGGDAGSVGVTDAGVADTVVRLTVDAPDGSTNLDLTLDYDAAAGSAGSVTDGATAAASFTGAPVGDAAPPSVEAVTTLDRDGDGSVDGATVTFTEPINDSSLTPGDYTIGGNAADAFDTLDATDDETAQLRIATDANEDEGTDAKNLTYSPGTTADPFGNALAAVGVDDVVETDGANPVVSNFTLAANSGAELVVTFDVTESLANVTVDVTGPDSGSITSVTTTGPTHEGRLSVARDGLYNATLAVATDGADNAAAVGQWDTTTVDAYADQDDQSTATALSNVSTRERVTTRTGLIEVGVRFDGPKAGTIDVRGLATSGTFPGVYVTGVRITVAEELRETPSTVKFVVTSGRLHALDVDPGMLVAYRYFGGEWVPQETNVEPGPDLVVVSAETSGFSRFAVVAAAPTSSGRTTAGPETEAPRADGEGDAGSEERAGATPGDETSGGAGESFAARDADGGTETAREADARIASAGMPGFTAVSALLALVAVLVAVYHRP